jgi:putative sterol carrier protein
MVGDEIKLRFGTDGPGIYIKSGGEVTIKNNLTIPDDGSIKLGDKTTIGNGTITITGADSTSTTVNGGNIEAVKATFTGDIGAVNAALTGNVTAVNTTLSGSLTVNATSGSTTTSTTIAGGAISAASATLSGSLTAAGATLTGDVNITNLKVTGTTTGVYAILA